VLAWWLGEVMATAAYKPSMQVIWNALDQKRKSNDNEKRCTEGLTVVPAMPSLI
jgi:hypothetical protein